MAFFEYGEKELAHLRRRDRRLGAAIDRFGLLERELTPDLFSSLAACIVSQQISGKAAETVFARLEALSGGVSPASIDALAIERVQSCGLSFRKASYLKGAARSVASGAIDLESVRALDDAKAVEALSSLKGVGVWTAEMLLIFSLGRPDVFSWGDFGIKRGLSKLHGIEELTRERFELFRKKYSPYCSVASFYLWELAGERD